MEIVIITFILISCNSSGRRDICVTSLNQLPFFVALNLIIVKYYQSSLPSLLARNVLLKTFFPLVLHPRSQKCILLHIAGLVWVPCTMCQHIAMKVQLQELKGIGW
jgi:hypothetical protein